MPDRNVSLVQRKAMPPIDRFSVTPDRFNGGVPDCHQLRDAGSPLLDDPKQQIIEDITHAFDSHLATDLEFRSFVESAVDHLDDENRYVSEIFPVAYVDNETNQKTEPRKEQNPVTGKMEWNSGIRIEFIHPMSDYGDIDVFGHKMCELAASAIGEYQNDFDSQIYTVNELPERDVVYIPVKTDGDYHILLSPACHSQEDAQQIIDREADGSLCNVYAYDEETLATDIWYQAHMEAFAFRKRFGIDKDSPYYADHMDDQMYIIGDYTSDWCAARDFWERLSREFDGNSPEEASDAFNNSVRSEYNLEELRKENELYICSIMNHYDVTKEDVCKKAPSAASYFDKSDLLAKCAASQAKSSVKDTSSLDRQVSDLKSSGTTLSDNYDF